VLRRARSYIGPLGVLGIVVPVVTGLKYGPMGEELGRYAGRQVTMIGSPVNALFVARVVLPPTVFLFLPLFVSLVAGDQVSGEASEGTLRALLARPISRLRLLAAKFVVSVVYAALLTVFLGVAAFTLGWALFGLGGLVSFGGGIAYFGMAEGVHRLLIAYGAAIAYQICVTSIAFLLSVFMNSSLAPVGVTFALMLVLGALGEIPYFERVKPFLFTNYADLFLKAFVIPLDAGALLKGVAALGAWTAAAFSLASAVFVRKDILS